MSDPKYGDPIEEDGSGVDDVVGSANEGLADAEEAARDAAAPVENAASSETHVDEPAAPVEAEPATSSVEHPDFAEPERAERTAPSDLGRYDSDADLSYLDAHTEPEPTPTTVLPEPAADLTPPAVDEAPTTRIDDAPTSRLDDTPATVAPAAVPVSQQPIFVQAPEAPLPRGNRGAAGAIGLLAAVSFASLYLVAALALTVLTQETTVDSLVSATLAAVQSWWFWVPVVVFFLGFWLLGAIINRGRWGNWVIFGLLVGVVAYGGHILGQLFQAPFWELTAREGTAVVERELLAPLAIVAFILGRELTIWFGAWVAARGRRMTELNNEAQREYERTLEAGPRLSAE